MARITSVEELRLHYGLATERASRKVITKLETYTRTFIALSPFVLLGSSDGRGNADVTPRGDHPGFVLVLDDTTLVLPDRPGNNRLDTWSNLIADPAVGLLFLVPGFSEMLRINGAAEIRDDVELLDRFAINGRSPRTVAVIKITEIFLHCAKAIMRSRLWDTAAHADRSLLPSMGQMLKEHGALSAPAETDEETLARNNAELF
jgi:PPOX class probable FMN-dependent enzyme